MYIEKLNKLIESRGGREAVFAYETPKPFQDRFKHGILFYEQHILNNPLSDETIYTLIEERKGYLPLKALYLEVADPTEYKFAKTCFCSYEHYCKLMEHAYFKRFINKCRDELELKLRSEAVNKIKDEALEGSGSSAIIASKYIIERGWIGNKKDREVLKRRFQQDKEINATIENDLKLLEVKV